jgi:hypothetical protein
VSNAECHYADCRHTEYRSAPIPTRKHYNRPKRLASDKRSSLLERSCKKFYSIDNQEENIKIETAKGSKAGILKLSYDHS